MSHAPEAALVATSAPPSAHGWTGEIDTLRDISHEAT